MKYESKQSKRHKVRIGVFIILENNNKIFLIKRTNTSFEDGSYFFPSGHLDEKETIEEAVVRECKEEIGVIPKKIKLVHVMHGISSLNEKEYIDLFFYSNLWEGNPKNNEPKKSTEANWFEINWNNLDSLPSPFPDFIKFALNKIKENISYSDYGWNK